MIHLLEARVNDKERIKLNEVGVVLEFCANTFELMQDIYNNAFDVTRDELNYSLESLRNRYRSNNISMISSINSFLFDNIAKVYANTDNEGGRAVQLIYSTISNADVLANGIEWVDRFQLYEIAYIPYCTFHSNRITEFFSPIAKELALLHKNISKIMLEGMNTLTSQYTKLLRKSPNMTKICNANEERITNCLTLVSLHWVINSIEAILMNSHLSFRTHQAIFGKVVGFAYMKKPVDLNAIKDTLLNALHNNG